MALFAVKGLGYVVSFTTSFTTNDALRSLAGIAIAMAFLYFLTRLPVRRYFLLSS